MRTFEIWRRDALNWARRLAAGLARPGRGALALVIAATTFVSALGPPPAVVAADLPAGADAPRQLVTHADARIQLVIKSIYFYDDSDTFGSGEIYFSAAICQETFSVAVGATTCQSGDTVSWNDSFSADTGDTKTFDRVLPSQGDPVSGRATPEDGISVYPGERYRFTAFMSDEDTIGFDYLGTITAELNKENNWELGTYTVRSIHDDGSPGDYDLTFEIRRTPLPDFRINGVRQIESTDGHFYCVQVENVGERPSGLIPLVVRANGVNLRTPTLPALGPTQVTEHCVIRSELPPGQVQLEFLVDEYHEVAEMDEENPPYVMTIPAVSATGAPGTTASPQPAGEDGGAPAPPDPKPQPKPTGAQADQGNEQADLTVGAIKLNGQPPNAPDACKPGKNVVTVVVKNAGKGDADSFTARLTVDGDDLDATVDGLATDQEREVRFDGVPLKAGQHALRAVADPDHVVGESKDANNELKVAVTCKGA